MKNVSKRDVFERVLSGYDNDLMEAGITERRLAHKLKQELNAKKNVRVKLKGTVNPKSLPRGIKVLATTGTITETNDGPVYGDGESLLGWEEVDWRTRQQARMDAQKLFDCYPADRIVFPNKQGEPQDLSGGLSNLDLASRLLFLLEKAKRRKELHDSGDGKDK